jgi:hypothetical protein
MPRLDQAKIKDCFEWRKHYTEKLKENKYKWQKWQRNAITINENHSQIKISNGKKSDQNKTAELGTVVHAIIPVILEAEVGR